MIGEDFSGCTVVIVNAAFGGFRVRRSPVRFPSKNSPNKAEDRIFPVIFRGQIS
jgi:hypothetical protein